MLGKFLLANKSEGRFRNLVFDQLSRSFFRGTGSLRTRSLAFRPLPLRDKEPDRAHQMLGGNIDIPLPENLRDPVSVGREASLHSHEALRVWRLAFRTPAFAKPTARQAVLVVAAFAQGYGSQAVLVLEKRLLAAKIG